MDTYFFVGLGMMGLAVLLFVLGLPRRGEVAGILRGRDGLQAFGMMAIICILALGLIVTLSHLR